MTSFIFLFVIVALLALLVWQATSNKSNEDNYRQLSADNAAKDTLARNLTAQLQEAKEKNEQQAEKIQELRDKITQLSSDYARLEEKISNFTTEKAELEKQAKAQFENLANQIFDYKSEQFKKLNESRINEILSPLKENIAKFEEAFNKGRQETNTERQLLTNHINDLINMNKTLSNEATNLTKALKGDSKVQGDWGEMILQTILENCGMEEGVHFEVQRTTDDNGNTLRNEEGKGLRPDVILNFPDNKQLIIDSKVSLTAYSQYCEEDDPAQKKEYLKNHVRSVRQHIDELKNKKYQDHFERAADFVLMFMPNEGAYLTAMQADKQLWQYAYDHHVVIIDGTHLISILKLIEQLWQHDKQTKNAITIAEETGKLYDKLSNFLADLLAIGKHLKDGQAAYDKAINKLSDGKGNILSKIEKVKGLGAKTSKSLPITSDDIE